MENIKLSVFDIDGTIKTDEGVPDSIRAGFRLLKESGVKVTVLTGKGYSRMKSELGDDFEHVTTPGVPMGMENGARIVYDDGRTVSYYPLTVEDVRSTLAIGKNNISDLDFIFYYPSNTNERVRVWSPDRLKTEKLTSKYGSFAQILEMPIANLEAELLGDLPCMLTLRVSPGKLKKFEDSLSDSDLNAVENENEIHITAAGITKESGVREIANLCGLHLNEISVAGNHLNDVSMLTNGLVGFRIVVGEVLDVELASHDINIKADSPSHLGEYLVELLSNK